MRAALPIVVPLVVLASACGRIGFDGRSPETHDGALDAVDDSRCTWSPPEQQLDLESSEADAEPALSPDGTRIVFTSARAGDDISRLYMSVRQGAGWSAPALITPINSDMGEGGAGWSADGRRIYFASYRTGPLHLYVSTMDNEFTTPALVPGLELLTEHTAPTLRGDELEMFYSSRLPPSRIQRATRTSPADPWTARGNVDALGTATDHGFPGVTADGLAIYLEVARPASGFRIMRSRRATIEQPFGALEEVPELDEAGSSHGDPQPSFDGTEMYFASNRSPAQGYGIYRSTRLCP